MTWYLTQQSTTYLERMVCHHFSKRQLQCALPERKSDLQHHHNHHSHHSHHITSAITPTVATNNRHNSWCNTSALTQARLAHLHAECVQDFQVVVTKSDDLLPGQQWGVYALSHRPLDDNVTGRVLCGSRRNTALVDCRQNCCHLHPLQKNQTQ